MSDLRTDVAPDAEWDLAYDDVWFLPLPTVQELADASAGERWVRQAVEHYGSRGALTAGDREALRVTAQGLLSMAGAGITQLWFTPPAAYSDVLVQITVGAVDGVDEADLLAEIGELPDATAAEVVAIETDTHGQGMLLRRTSAVLVDEVARPIANWTVLLRAGRWLIRAEAFGSTLETFALMEEHLPRLLSGVTLPREGAR